MRGFSRWKKDAVASASAIIQNARARPCAASRPFSLFKVDLCGAQGHLNGDAGTAAACAGGDWVLSLRIK